MDFDVWIHVLELLVVVGVAGIIWYTRKRDVS